MPIGDKNEFAQTSFSSWYENFSDVTFYSKILTVPSSFIDYLKQDGVFLPKASGGEHELGEWKHETNEAADDGHDDTNFDELDSENDDLHNLQNIPDFRDFQEKVENVLQQLGGEVFPKMNWSSPKDASWIAFGNSLKCKTSNEIFLLLKSSDFVLHDLEQRELQKIQDPFTLVLRQWYDIHPGSEFRCFVQHKNLIGICQRDRTTCYPFIVNAKEDYRRDICKFFLSRVQNNFPIASYTFDVYRRNDGSYWIVDFNPFGHPTDGILFEWDELNHDLTDGAESQQTPSPNGSESLNGSQSILGNQHHPNGEGSRGDQRRNGDGTIRCSNQLEPSASGPNNLRSEDLNNDVSPSGGEGSSLDHVPLIGHPGPVFRCVEQPPSLGPAEYRQYAYPADVARLVSGEGHAELVDLIRQASVRGTEELSDASTNSN